MVHDHEINLNEFAVKNDTITNITVYEHVIENGHRSIYKPKMT